MIPPSRVCVSGGLLVNRAICALPRQASISTSLASPRLNFINFAEVLRAARSGFVMTQQSGAETSQSEKVARLLTFNRLNHAKRMVLTFGRDTATNRKGCIRAFKLHSNNITSVFPVTATGGNSSQCFI